MTFRRVLTEIKVLAEPVTESFQATDKVAQTFARPLQQVLNSARSRFNKRLPEGTSIKGVRAEIVSARWASGPADRAFFEAIIDLYLTSASRMDRRTVERLYRKKLAPLVTRAVANAVRDVRPDAVTIQSGLDVPSKVRSARGNIAIELLVEGTLELY